MTGSEPALELVEIHILGMPVDAYREASEHGDELLREFALIREQEAEGGREVPRRLLRLVDELTDRFSGFTATQTAELAEAIARGAKTVDLHYLVPPSVKNACISLGAMLDEVDEFCRQGEELLTLATPPRAVAFRNWYLDQFIRQVDGKEPTTWREAG
ncbi:MAG TPA: hypothetical protein VF045_04915 [Acidimicrobiales bacterium]